MTASTITKVSIAAATAIVAFVAIGALFAHADAAPTINTSIRNPSEVVITSALVGASVHSVTQVASSTSSTTPQGTVDFNVYGNTACSGSATEQSNVALVNGFATSTANIVSVAGLSYKVHYDGDINNIATDGPCVPLTATSNTGALTLGLSASTITAGQSVTGSSTLSGVTSNASGTVAYSVFTNSGCTTPFGGAGNVSVTSGLVPNSPPFQFVIPGTYFWQAVYSGDSANNAATSTCGSGQLVVNAAPVGKNSPTVATSLSTTSATVLTGSVIHDSATLNGETANATGTVSYKVYTDNTCSALFANAGTKSVTNGTVLDSDNVTLNTAGTYYWQALYSGDAGNNAATSTCASEAITVVAAPSPTPQPGTSNTLSGQAFNDTNKNGVKDSGEGGIAGIKINLYNSANFNNGAYDPVFKTTTTDGNGNYSFTGITDGTYSVEELKKNGWKQNSDDFASVAVTGGIGKTGLDFANVQKKGDKDEGNNGHKGSKGGKCEGNNGLHLGWFIGKGNQGKDKHCSVNENNNASSTKHVFKLHGDSQDDQGEDD